MTALPILRWLFQVGVETKRAAKTWALPKEDREFLISLRGWVKQQEFKSPVYQTLTYFQVAKNDLQAEAGKIAIRYGTNEYPRILARHMIGYANDKSKTNLREAEEQIEKWMDLIHLHLENVLNHPEYLRPEEPR